MGTTNYGIDFARAAERMRGLRFSERFLSTDDMEKNTASIAGSIASYDKVDSIKTVVAKLKSAQTESMTVKINSSQTITITAGNLFGSYSNATAFDADDIQIDDYSKFEFVKMFRDQLSSEEITAYQNGTMWNYDNDCVLWMDGKLRRYDPDNNRHLDASRSKNHVAFGDGSTASTFPTKLAERGGGYSFDGIGDYMTTDEVDLNSYDELTFVVKALPGYNGPAPIICWGDSAGLVNGIAFDANSLISLHNGKFVSLSKKPREILHLANVIKKSTNSFIMYKNGQLYSTNAGGASAGTLRDQNEFNIQVYRLSPSTTLYGLGELYQAAVFKCALNQTQIYDMYLRMQNPEV